MPRTRKDEAPVLLDQPEIEGRYVELDDCTVSYETHRTDAALAPGDAGAGPMTTATRPDARTCADLLITLLETGTSPEGLFDPDVFLDFTMPTWRLQAQGIEDTLAARRAGHPTRGRVPRSRFDPTPTGFVLEVEETWADGGEHWYCREMFRADLGPAGITALSVYCTGDWDRARVAEHAREMTLIRA